MPKRATRRVSKKTQWKIIVLLFCVVALLLWVSYRTGAVGSRGGVTTMQMAAQSDDVRSSQRNGNQKDNGCHNSRNQQRESRHSNRDGEKGPQQDGQLSPNARTKAGAVSDNRGNPTECDQQTLKQGDRLALPYYKDSTFVLRNVAARYTLCYDTMYQQAAWVAYILTRAEVNRKGTERQNAFCSDPTVVQRGWPTARDRDYTRSGYDRGHLLPSADRDDTPEENRATFYLSNVSPQRPALNRQIWRLLEEQVRKWAKQYDSLYVVTGPVLVSGLPRIKGGVGVPRRYFKALLVWQNGRYHAIAFLLPNQEKISGKFGDYAMSVNDLEKIIGYDLFWRLPDQVEERVESEVDTSFWKAGGAK